MKLRKNATLVLSLILLSGCATIFSGTTQNINVKVINADTNEDLEGVKCQAFDGSGGSYFFSTNPATISVSRSGPVTITCKKNEFKQLNTTVGDSFNATTLVNILFWPGFLVDAATGSYKKFPSHYLVSMERVKK